MPHLAAVVSIPTAIICGTALIALGHGEEGRALLYVTGGIVGLLLAFGVKR